MKLFSFKSLRVVMLLLLLAGVAFYTKDVRLTARGWYKPLHVTIFPINGDGSNASAEYIDQLTSSDFATIDEFMARQGQRYKVISSKPTITRLGSSIERRPPDAPDPGSNVLSIVLWSLKLRWWAYWNTPDDLSNKQRVRMFVLYHKGKEGVSLKHSLGLQKGFIGVVHAFASHEQGQQNNIVIAHELLHTVGATDKYNAQGQPAFPTGFAEPHRDPLYPQRRAEIMAGRVPLSPHDWKMARSLRSVVIGAHTAREINWMEGS